MRLAMIGLGRMGANMVQRLLEGGHECVAYDRDAASRERMAGLGAVAVDSIESLVAELPAPRLVWMMVPAGAVDDVIAQVAPLLAAGDVLVDGGNTHYRDDVRRAAQLAKRGVGYLDVGVSGGVFGLANGYCLMIGGDRDIAVRLAPVFATLSPDGGAAGRDSVERPELGFLWCGDTGAGHFVKMVHNGIEYGLMAAYAEGFNLLERADAGEEAQVVDAETAPVAGHGLLRYDFDTSAIAELWRHGSVVRSWLLDLTADALRGDPSLAELQGRVSDSGEGRWTLHTAIDAAVPMPVLAAALHARFSSRGEGDYANRLLSAMRREFGGHHER